MFLSDVFSSTFVNTTQTPLELYETNGAEGAARGAAWAHGFYTSREDTFGKLKKIHTLEPQPSLLSSYEDHYNRWRQLLTHLSIQDEPVGRPG